jgi:hypothetical protein
MEGVMTGIVDRENHAEIPFVGIGSDEGAMVRANETDGIRSLINNNTNTNDIYQPSSADLELKQDIESFGNSRKLARMLMGRDSGIGSDIVAQALISGGLRAIGGAGAGKGKAAELATAFSPVVDRAFEQLQKRKDTELGLAAELYKGKNVGDLAEIRYAKEIARIEAIPEEKRSQADKEILTNLRARQKEASPYLKGPSPQAAMAQLKSEMSKDKFAYGVAGFDDLEITRVAKVASEAQSKIFRGEDPGFQVGIYPSKEELEQIDENTIKYNPTVEPRGRIKSKFTSGGVYYLPAIDNFGVYDGNTKTFKIK